MTLWQRTLTGMTVALSVVAGSFVCGPVPIAAQSGLEQVERLTRLGRTDEARAELLDWWDAERADASRRELQRGLWLRGRLTVDPVQAELDFQRVALLYPSGQFTPNAVLRLAQASWAMGDEPAARRYLDTLQRDYRRFEAWEQAQEWIADAGPLPPPGDTPNRSPEPVREGGEAAEMDAPERPVQDSPVVVQEEAEPEQASSEMNYHVQLGAFVDEDRAVALFEEVQAQDIDVRLVQVDGSQFTHVRIGRFAQRAAAVELLEELTAQGISAALVRDDREERSVRN